MPLPLSSFSKFVISLSGWPYWRGLRTILESMLAYDRYHSQSKFEHYKKCKFCSKTNSKIPLRSIFEFFFDQTFYFNRDERMFAQHGLFLMANPEFWKQQECKHI